MSPERDPASTVKSTPEAIKEIDVLCDEFESQWKDGHQPEIADFLRRTQHASASTLLVELVKLDFHYREKNGETPSFADYETRFSQYPDALRELGSHLPSHLLQNRDLGKFRLLHHIGQGGFGDVWDAIDTVLNRRVAIKTPRDRHPDPTQIRMFLREAQAIALLDHPGIVRIYEHGEQHGRAYIASEFIEGPTLTSWVKTREVTPQDAARICLKIAEGLTAAHAKDVIHRDLKPGNVMMPSDDCPKIVDFGLAKQMDGGTQLTRPGQVMGTYAYMSPEQAQGNKVDHRSDIYSLGVILYELLTNRVPFKGVGPEMVTQIVKDDPATPRSFNLSIPKDLETICLKAISKTPEKRYQSALELSDDLQRFLRGDPITARRSSSVESALRWIRRNVTLSALIGLSSFMLLGLGGWSWSKYTEYRAARMLVSINTQPEGAKVIFVPLDPRTGDPRPENKVATGPSPIKQMLLPGDYLVVAYMDDEFFHEVYRHVPDEEESKTLPKVQRHLNWFVTPDGPIKLPTVTLFHQQEVTKDMVKPTENSHVYLDQTEITVGQYRSVIPPSINASGDVVGSFAATCGDDIPADFAARCISYDEALVLTELLGKRLPALEEYGLLMPTESIQQQATPQIEIPVLSGDTIAVFGGQELYGLLSNVSEWTTSSPSKFMIGNEPQSVSENAALASRATFGPRVRAANERADYQNFVGRNELQPDVGFRGSRSATPRFIKR